MRTEVRIIMKRSNNAIAVALLAVALPSCAADWVQMGENQGSSMYMDT
jgi:hypothetical protein